MGKANHMKLRELRPSLVPEDDAAIGNQALQEAFLSAAGDAGLAVKDELFDTRPEDLLADGTLVKGKGRGSCVRWTEVSAEGCDLRRQHASVPEVAPASKSRWR